MIYNEFADKKISGLGLGMMRLPVKDGNDAVIDEEAAAQMIDRAVKSGVNYFDTAWGYHGETSELVAGRLLSAYPRESYYLASKFPGYDNANMDKVKSIFARQLEKCRTAYFDFYMFHNVYEGNIDDYLDPRFGIMEHLLEVQTSATEQIQMIVKRLAQTEGVNEELKANDPMKWTG